MIGSFFCVLDGIDLCSGALISGTFRLINRILRLHLMRH